MHRPPWENMRMGFQHRMPYYRQNHQTFPNQNFRNWVNPPFNNQGYQQEYRHYKRNYGHPYNKNGRRYDRKNNNWMMSPEDCFVDTMNMQSRKRDQRSMSRERSAPPSVIENFFRNERLDSDNPYSRAPSSLGRRSSSPFCNQGTFRKKSDVKCPLPDENSSSPSAPKKSRSIAINGSLSPPTPFKRTIHNEPVKEHVEIQWSDSDSDVKDDKQVQEVKTKVLQKKDLDLVSKIWSYESDNDEDKGVENYAKYNSKTLPKYDGKTIVGDEGVFEIKLLHCSFCNILCKDKEKSRIHMLTRYHYNHYKDFLITLESVDKEKRKK